MSRSLVILLCNALILSVLSLAWLGQPAPTAARAAARGGPPARPQAVTDILDSLTSALKQERERQTGLSGQLESARTELRAREERLAEQEQQLGEIQTQLSAAEAEARRLTGERSRLQQEQTRAQERLVALEESDQSARRDAEELQARLAEAGVQTAEARGRLEALERELAERRADAERMQERLAAVEAERREADLERQRLALELQANETKAPGVPSQDRPLAVGAAATKNGLRDQAGKLVESLPTQSTNLVRELNVPPAVGRPLAAEHERYSANQVFGEFTNNRVNILISGQRRGFLGDERSRQREASGVLFRHGDGIYTVLHADDTPLKINSRDAAWEGFTGQLRRGQATAPLRALALASSDPRVVVAPISEEAARILGGRIYDIAEEPARFTEAVLVGAGDQHDGEITLRLNPGTPGYVRVLRPVQGRTSGRFSPSRGDVVLTHTGQLLGILVTAEHGVLLDHWEPGPLLPFNQTITPQFAREWLSEAEARLQRLPAPLQ